MRTNVNRKTKIPPITFRPRQKHDDSFIIRVALQTMQQVYEESMGVPLTAQKIENQLGVNKTNMVIEEDNRPIGYYSYTLLPSGLVYLGALVLSPEAQGKKIGRKVVNQIEREVREKGAHTITAHVQRSNNRAIVFWLKRGYKVLEPDLKGALSIEKRLRSE